MSLEANVYQFLLGHGLSGEVIFGLRKGDEIPPYLVLGYALNFNSCNVCNIDKKITQSE